jgi:hypothetical protein
MPFEDLTDSRTGYSRAANLGYINPVLDGTSGCGKLPSPGMDQLIPNLSTFVPRLRGTIMLSGCGLWTQQERARESMLR